MFVLVSHSHHNTSRLCVETFHNVYEVDGIKGDTEHEVPEPEDAHEEDKPCFIWSRHDLSRNDL